MCKEFHQDEFFWFLPKKSKEVTSSLCDKYYGWIVNSFLECTIVHALRVIIFPAQIVFCPKESCPLLTSQMRCWQILSQKFKPYQVKHVEDQKQVVEGFVNSLEMPKKIQLFILGRVYHPCWEIKWIKINLINYELTSREINNMDKNQFDW